MSVVSIQDKRLTHPRSPRHRPASRHELPPRKRATQLVSCMLEISLIGRYLSADLDPQLSQAFEAHLASCPDCLAFLSTYRKTVEITGAFLDLQALRHKPRPLTLRTSTHLAASPHYSRCKAR
jgi:anti-sigma factor RsiW